MNAIEQEAKRVLTPIFLRDLATDKQTSGFLGEALTKAIQDSENMDCDVVVGYFATEPYAD